MLRTAIRNLVAHKARLLMSGLAVALGVAFTAGTLTFTDTLGKTFTDLFEDAAADVNVEPKATFETGMTGMTGMGMDSATSSVPASLVDEVARVDGAGAAAGYVQVEGVYVLDADGDVADTGGAPGIGISWTEEPELNSATIVEGRAPTTAGEVAIDSTTADDLGYDVGDTVTVLTPGPKIEADLVGILRFGQDGGLAGASMTAFDVDTAQQLLLTEGAFTGIGVSAADGVNNDDLAGRVAAALGDRYDVTTGEQKAAAQAASLEESLAFINTFLLVFAGVALFVGSFIILNTFSMLTAQRTRELALLRALGASRRQVTRSVLLEALLLGALGAMLGVTGGYGLALGLKALFGQFGLSMEGGLVLTATTVAWSVAVGVLVTLVAAYVPARRAARVAPVAAMRADVVSTPRPLRARTLVGSSIAVLGATAVITGVILDALGLVGLGATGLMAAAIALSPVLAVPFVRSAGHLPPRLAGKTGHLARENALRNPRRTAATSSALMIGLALVSAFSIIGASAQASVDKVVEDVLRADYVISATMGQPFTAEAAKHLRHIDGVASVTQERYGTALIEGRQAHFSAYDPATLGDALAINMVDGDLSDLTAHTVLVSHQQATDADLTVGDQVAFQVANGRTRRLEVGGVYGDDNGLGAYVVSMDTYLATGGAPMDQALYVNLDPTADAGAVRKALQEVVDAFPVAELQDADAYKEDKRAGIDQMLLLINALLALSVLIAVLGVVNTLVLSVIERTRELGLLRALGMTRRQLRRMVRLESVLIAVYGAALGLGLGTLLGLVATTTLRSQGLTQTAVPLTQLVLFLVLGAVIGVTAAALPARRAGRLRVLNAIATS